MKGRIEFSVMEKVVLKPVPLAGADPVPVQLVQVQTVLPSVTGLDTLQVTDAPEL
jgi:hypothetical protein